MNTNPRSWAWGLALAGAALTIGLSTAAEAGQVKFDGSGHAVNPVWSLDGKHLAFEVNTYGGDGISMYFAEISGENAKNIQRIRLPGSSGPYSSQQVVMNATWHPQGLAVFEGSNSGGKFRLYFAQPGGAMAAEMLSTQKAPGNLQFPVVSPNGNLLGYISDQFGRGDVMTWDRSSDQIKQVTKTPGDSEVFPFFNSDGSKILYVRKGTDASVHEVNLSSGAESKVVADNGDQTRPVYAGSKVLYFSSERGEGKWDLISINADGSGKKVLAKEIKLPERSRPAVSADGKYVSYVYSDPTKDSNVYLQPVTGGAEIKIGTTFTACSEPAIGMAGGRYMLAFTALPSDDSDWRFLYVKDISDSL